MNTSCGPWSIVWSYGYLWFICSLENNATTFESLNFSFWLILIPLQKKVDLKEYLYSVTFLVV